MNKAGPETEKGRKPRFRSISSALQKQIRGGQLAHGELLPSTRELARQFEVNRKTVMLAYQELLSEGWVDGGQRKRLRVAFVHPAPAGQASAVDGARRFDWGVADDSVPFFPVSAPFRSFRWGFPEVRRLPIQEIRSCYRDALKALNHRMMDYGSPQGWPPLVKATAEHLRKGRGISGREVFITQGAGDALALAISLALKPGDAVLMEDPGYHLAAAQLRQAGARVVPVPVSAEGGLDLRALRSAVEAHRPRAIYLTPLHQFPTLSSMDADRRREVYALAREFDFVILEDDYDHELHFDGVPQTPLVASDPDERVLYIGTFSKILYPGVRLGCLVVPTRLKAEVFRLKRLGCRHPDQLTQDAIARWFRSGGADRYIRRLLRLNRLKRDHVEKCLLEAKRAGARIEWKRPSGGTAYWVNVFEDAGTFRNRALELGFQCFAEAVYRLDGATGTHVRFGFSNVSLPEIENGMKLFRQALADPGPRHSEAGKTPLRKRAARITS